MQTYLHLSGMKVPVRVMTPSDGICTLVRRDTSFQKWVEYGLSLVETLLRMT